MCRFVLYTSLTLCCSALAATAADRHGGWLPEQPRNSERTLSFKQSVQLNNKIETLELGFICDQRKTRRVSAQYSYLLMERFKTTKM